MRITRTDKTEIKPLMMCEVCWNRATNRYVVGYIEDNISLDLCDDCGYHYEHIPNYIPKEQNLEYLKLKINGKQ